MNKRQIADAAKSAWEKATADKKPQAEIDQLKADYDTKEAAAKAEEEAAKKVPAATKELTMEEVQASIVASVKTALADILPKNQVATLTEEGVKAIVEAALAKQFPKDDKGMAPKITEEGIKSVVTTVLEEQVKKSVRESKMLFGGGNDSVGDQNNSNIEVPYGLTKGNLPLHMKQLLNILLQKPQNEGIDAKIVTKGIALGDQMFLGMKVQGAKALTTGGTNTGAEWIPRDLSSELNRRLYLDSQVAQAFMGMEVAMPTDPFDYPLHTTDPVFYLNTTQNTDATASDPGTAKFTLTTKRLMALVQYSYEADEDSIIPLLPTIQFALGRAAARALENAIINGDTTSTHQDSDVTDPKAQEKAWMGFRKLALAVATLKSDISSGGLSRANLTAILKLLGKWGSRTGDLLWIVGPKGWSTLLGLDEFALAYARGGASTFSSGAPLSSPYGGQIVISEQCRENLNASGVYDGSTTTKGSILLVYKPGFVLGSRREFTIETARNIRSQTNDIVASFRKAFQPVETPAATTAQTVAVGFNYAA